MSKFKYSSSFPQLRRCPLDIVDFPETIETPDCEKIFTEYVMIGALKKDPNTLVQGATFRISKNGVEGGLGPNHKDLLDQFEKFEVYEIQTDIKFKKLTEKEKRYLLALDQAVN